MKNVIIVDGQFIHKDFVKDMTEIRPPGVDSVRYFDDSGDTSYPKTFWHWHFIVEMYEFKNKIFLADSEEKIIKIWKKVNRGLKLKEIDEKIDSV